MMNKIQAINILTNLSSKAVNSGIIEDILEAGAIYNALMVLSQGLDVESDMKDKNDK